MNDLLEDLIDRDGLASVLGALAQICHGKAEHVRVNWGDGNLARDWDSMARILDRAETKAICRLPH